MFFNVHFLLTCKQVIIITGQETWRVEVLCFGLLEPLCGFFNMDDSIS